MSRRIKFSSEIPKTLISNEYSENKINGFVIINRDEFYNFLSKPWPFIELFNVNPRNIQKFCPQSIYYLKFGKNVEKEEGVRHLKVYVIYVWIIIGTVKPSTEHMLSSLRFGSFLSCGIGY